MRRRTYNKKDILYPSNGLVLWLDGIWNKAIGVHEAFAGWNDLTGKHTVTPVNILASNWYSNNHYVTTNGRYYFKTNINMYELGKNYTVICYAKPNSSVYTNYKGLFGVCHQGYTYTLSELVGFQYEGGTVFAKLYPGSLSNAYNSSECGTDKTNYIIRVDNMNNIWTEVNNIPHSTSGSCNYAQPPYPFNFIFGQTWDANDETTDRNFIGNMYSCLVYNRALTDAEITKIKNINTARFA